MASPAFAHEANTEDRIRAVLNALIHERQELRRRGTDAAALEANRIGIVYWQRKLSRRVSKAPLAEPT